ncbi:MAG: RNA methyltransferase [Actinomycetota bacterium]|nr:RNA methyltransferase [Actinomycetota bacterium]
MSFIDLTRAASAGAALTPRSGRVRHCRRLAVRAFRTERREFLAEGPQAVREAMAHAGDPCPCLEVYATRYATERHAELAAAADRADVVWTLVDDDVLAALCDTVSPQGMVARCRFIDIDLDAMLSPPPPLLALCADVRDPGNAGAVIRCADAAGAGGVALVGSSVDPYNPKAVRSSAGSVFHVALSLERDAPRAIASASAAGLAVLAADADADLDLEEAEESGLLDQPAAWLFGNEAWGLPDDLRRRADRVINVPIHGRAESLNLATAAALCLYASARAQRRTVGDRTSSQG